MIKILIILSALLLSAHTTVAQSWKSELDSALQVMSSQEIFQGQLLIAQKGQIVFHKAYDKGQTKLTDPLPIQSVTKAFTALAIHMLEEREALSFEDLLTDYFPELPYPNVRIRDLLDMKSGLPRFFETALRFGDTTKTVSNEEIIALVVKHRPKARQPEGRFEYNNTNYLLLGSIIQKVSGMSYSHFVKKHILEPLRMNETQVKNLNKSEPFEKINADNFYQPYGEGNVLSTTGDLFKLDRALTEKWKSFDQRLLSLYEQSQDVKAPDYLLGWSLRKDGRGLQTRIVGDGQSTRTIWQRYLNGERSIIYIHTAAVGYQEQVFGVIRNILNGNDYELPLKRTVYEVDPSTLKTYVGQYLSEMFGLLHITESDGKLYLRPDPVPGTELLVPSSKTTFYFLGQPLEWEFFLNEQGKVIGLGFKGDRKNMGSKQE